VSVLSASLPGSPYRFHGGVAESSPVWQPTVDRVSAIPKGNKVASCSASDICVTNPRKRRHIRPSLVRPNQETSNSDSDTEVATSARKSAGIDAPIHANTWALDATLHASGAKPRRKLFSVITRGTMNCSKYSRPPALVPPPDIWKPPNGCRCTTAPVMPRLM